MVDKVGQPQVNKVLKVLVRNAVEEFGFIPRDVYNGVVSLPRTRQQHASAMANLTYTKLKDLVSVLAATSGLIDEFSHRVVVINPLPVPPSLANLDLWEIEFKSIRIAEQMMGRMQLEEDKNLREMYISFPTIPEGSNLAGWIFEAIVHRMFSHGWRSEFAPQSICMTSNNRDPPLFSQDSSPPTSNNPLPSFAQLHASTRTATRVDFTGRQLSDVTLDNDKYYIPTATNNPLFDSFTIGFDSHAVIISVFQITVSSNHKGSAIGYLNIRKIMRRVRELLEKTGSNATVKVAYFLVCPDDGSPHQWQMPVDWNNNTKINDHRGDGFFIRVPVSGHRGTSRLFTLNFATELNHC